MEEGAQWSQQNYDWQPQTLQASLAKPAPPRRQPRGPVCQVEGCNADLTNLRNFFIKQRICEQHARADVVTDSAGRQLRFCQQCTRLEPLVNFNTARRSCKTSLAKRQSRAHRGKAGSSPDSSPERNANPSDEGNSSSEGEASLNASGGKGSSRRSSGPVRASKRSRGSPPHSATAWPGLAPMNSNNSCRLASPVGSHLAHSHQPTMPEQAQPQPQPQQQQQPQPLLAMPHSLCEADLEELLTLDPEALADALLLPAGQHASKLKATVDGNGLPEPLPAVMSSLAQPLGCAAPSTSQPIPWAMMPQQVPVATPTMYAGTSAAPYGTAGPFPATALGGQWAGTDTTAGYAAGYAAAGGQPLPQPSPYGHGWDAQPEAAQIAAMQQQASGVTAAAQQTCPMHVVTRFSLKIFGVNPDHLPPQLRSELLAALQVSPTVLEGAIRCGCTRLIVDLLLSSEEQCELSTSSRLAAAMQHIRRPDNWRSSGPPPIVAQLGQLVAITGDGTASEAGGHQPFLCIRMHASQVPQLTLAGPMATTVSAASGTFHIAATAPIDAAQFPAGLAAAVRCRSHGKHVGLAVAVLRSSAGGLDSEAGSEERAPSMQVQLAQEQGKVVLEAWASDAGRADGRGLYEFELSSGSLLSDSVPVLVLPDAHADAAAELCQLQQQHQEVGGSTSPSIILRLVATVLRFLEQRHEAEAAGPGSLLESAFHAAYHPSATAKVAAVAQRLLLLAVQARWPAVARLLLPAITADGSSAAAAMRQLDALCGPSPTILHLAVASGSADTLVALWSWSNSQDSPAVEAASADLLLLAAGLGSTLDEQMVHQLAELLGADEFAQAADAVGPSGWSPRRVAIETNNAALLAAMPLVPAMEPDTKLSKTWKSKAYAAPKAAALPTKVCCKDGAKGGRLVEQAPSHDATLLAGLLAEMDVPPEPGTAAVGGSSDISPGASRSNQMSAGETRAAGTANVPVKMRGLSQQLVTVGMGAAAAALAALISIAVRMAA